MDKPNVNLIINNLLDQYSYTLLVDTDYDPTEMILITDIKENKTFFIRNDYDNPDIELREWEKEDVFKVRQNKDRYLKLPMLDHGEWHEVFKTWLKTIKLPEAYKTSIGLTLKCLAGYDINDYNEDKYYEYKNQWDEWRLKYYITLLEKYLSDL